jgi:hypothetical protein
MHHQFLRLGAPLIQAQHAEEMKTIEMLGRYETCLNKAYIEAGHEVEVGLWCISEIKQPLGHAVIGHQALGWLYSGNTRLGFPLFLGPLSYVRASMHVNSVLSVFQFSR